MLAEGASIFTVSRGHRSAGCDNWVHGGGSFSSRGISTLRLDRPKASSTLLLLFQG